MSESDSPPASKFPPPGSLLHPAVSPLAAPSSSLSTASSPLRAPSFPLLTPRSALAAAFAAALWFILCRHLSSEWSLNEQYSYGWFVPFFAAYLFWLRWESTPKVKSRKAKVENTDSFSPSAFLPRLSQFLLSTFTFLLLAALLPLRLFEVGNPDWRPLGWVHAIIVVSVTAIILWRIGGASWLRHFAFPICFIFVAVPWISAVETPVIQGLMHGVAAVAAETLNLFGIPAQLEGNLIRVSTGLVGVNEACSGVRSLQTSLMIGLLFGELKRLSLVRRLLLLAGAIAIAIVANCLRALFLVSVAASQQVSSVSRWHDIAGYSIVAAVFLGTVALAALLARKVESRNVKVENERADLPPAGSGLSVSHFLLPTSYFLLRTSYLLLSLLWLLFVEAGVETWYRLHERNLVVEPRWTVKWPTDASAFRSLEIDEGVKRTLRFDTGSEVAWPIGPLTNNQKPITDNSTPSNQQQITRDPRASAIAYFFRWNAGGSSVVRARAHSPEICLPDAGWQKVAEFGTRTYHVGALDVPFRQIVFRKQNGHAFAHTFFCLQEDQGRPDEERPDLRPFTGTQPDWGLAARARVVRKGVRNLGQQVLEIAFVGPDAMTSEAADAQLAELLRTIIVPVK